MDSFWERIRQEKIMTNRHQSHRETEVKSLQAEETASPTLKWRKNSVFWEQRKASRPREVWCQKWSESMQTESTRRHESHRRGFGFYSICSGKSLKTLNRVSDMICLFFVFFNKILCRIYRRGRTMEAEKSMRYLVYVRNDGGVNLGWWRVDRCGSGLSGLLG